MINYNEPLITCTMTTLGNIEHFKKSIQCFTEQTYCNKNFFIICHGKKENNLNVFNYIKCLKRNDIFFFEANQKMNLGYLHNTLIELSTGEIICQWNECEYYDKNRILKQYNFLRIKNTNIASVYVSNEIECDIMELQNIRNLYGPIMFMKKAFWHFDFFYPQIQNDLDIEGINVLKKLILIGDISIDII